MLPTLTMSGAVSDPMSIITKLYEYFLASRKSQSYFFNNVASLDYIIATSEVSDIDLGMNIKRELTNMYETYFEDVEVTVILTDIENNNFYTIGIRIETGNGYSLERSVSIVNNKIEMFNQELNLYKN